jgi:hypothetical protein
VQRLFTAFQNTVNDVDVDDDDDDDDDDDNNNNNDICDINMR